MMRRVSGGIFFILSLLVLYPSAAHALSSDPKQFISGDNTFYAYVQGGETISADFLRVNFDEPFDTVRGDVTITVDGPGVQEQKCVASKDVPFGQGCHFAAQTAPKSGIWRIQFAAPPGAKVYNQAAPNAHWGKNWFSWNITVADSTGEQHGRVWTEQYNLRQPADPSYTDDFTYYYISEDGYIYRAATKGYNGQISTLSADSIGVRKGDSCTSAYQSTDVGNADFSPALGTCGNAYKLFFEEPSGDLPATARRWDTTADWVRPNISRPNVSELHFQSDGSSDQLSGTITFYLRNFIGQYQIKIDADNDGSFDGQSDVVINQQMKKLDNGLQRVRFEGANRSGQLISPSATIGIKVAITKVAEIHFVAADVEGRTGGMELVRLNGDNAPTTGLCWNDTELAQMADNLMTTNPDGRSCPDSTGGVHGWPYADLSWGNARYIDDWVYASAKLDGSNQITYPDDVAATAAKKKMNWLLIAGVGTAFVVVIVALFVLIKRQRRNKRIASAQLPTANYQQGQPGQDTPPPPNDPNRY